jgi:hypothetical protein
LRDVCANDGFPAFSRDVLSIWLLDSDDFKTTLLSLSDQNVAESACGINTLIFLLVVLQG